MNENNFIKDQSTFQFGDFFLLENNQQGSISISRKYGDYQSLDTVVDSSSETALINNVPSLKLNFSDVKNLTKYGSLLEYINSALEYFSLYAPVSLHLKKESAFYQTKGVFNVKNVEVNQGFVKIELLTNFLHNKYSVVFAENQQQSYANSHIRNFKNRFTDFDFVYKGIRYPIISADIPQYEKNQILTIYLDASLFSSNIESRTLIEAYITPSLKQQNVFYNNLTALEKHLYQENFSFLKTRIESDKIVFFNQQFNFPKLNLFDFDFLSYSFDNLYEDLKQFAEHYDDIYGNILKEKLIPASFLSEEINDEEALRNINILLQTYSHSFDEIHQQTKAIKSKRNIGLNQDSKFYNNNQLKFSELGWSLNNVEYDEYEKLLENSSYIFKTKGTRSAFEGVFEYLNIPQQLYEIYEYEYEASEKIDIDLFESIINGIDINLTLNDFPVTNEGYPDIENSNFIFESKSFFKQYEDLLGDFNEKYIKSDIVNNSYESLFDETFNISGTPIYLSFFDDDFEINNCFSFTGEIINDPSPEIFLDDCRCEIPIIDKALQVCSSNNLLGFTGCTKFIADIVPNCVLSGEPLDATGYVFTETGKTPCTVEYFLVNPINGDFDNGYLTLNSSGTSYDLNANLFAFFQENDQKIFLTPKKFENIVKSSDYFLTENLSVSGHVLQINVINTYTDIEKTLNLNPLTTSYLTGCTGVVDPVDLYKPNNPLQITAWLSAIESLIKNAICEEYGLNAQYDLNLSYDDITDQLLIEFFHKVNPDSGWIEFNGDINLFQYNNGIESIVSNNLFTELSIIPVSIDQLIDSCNQNIVFDQSLDQGMLNALFPNNNIKTINNFNIDLISLSGNTITGCGCDIIELSGNTYGKGATFDINILGGNGPYSFFGLKQNEFLYENSEYTFFAEDVNGCKSNLVTGTVLCPIDPCSQPVQIATTTANTGTTTIVIPGCDGCDEVILTYFFDTISIETIEGVNTFNYNHNILVDDVALIDNVQISIIPLQSTIFGSVYVRNDNDDTFLDDGIEVEYTPGTQLEDTFFYEVIIDYNGCQYVYETTWAVVFDSPISFVERIITWDSETCTRDDQIVTTITGDTFTTLNTFIPAPVIASASYNCDEAITLNVSIEGGVAPYQIIGAQNGQILTQGETVSFYVVDDRGCESNIVELTVDCISQLDCVDILLNTSLECTSIDNNLNTAQLTYGFDIEGEPFSVEVETVSLSISGSTDDNSNNFLIGDPVERDFFTDVGAIDLDLDFNPFVPQEVTIIVTYEITLTNGCAYVGVEQYTVNAAQLGSEDTKAKYISA